MSDGPYQKLIINKTGVNRAAHGRMGVLGEVIVRHLCSKEESETYRL
jgi:hypothetical protein